MELVKLITKASPKEMITVIKVEKDSQRRQLFEIGIMELTAKLRVKEWPSGRGKSAADLLITVVGKRKEANDNSFQRTPSYEQTCCG